MSEIDRTQKQRRTRVWITGGCGLAIVGLSVLAGLYLSHRSDYTTYPVARAQAARQVGGVIVIGGADPQKPRVEIFEDFGCPICKEFENSGGNAIKKLASERKVSVSYRSIWLSRRQADPMRGNSLRAANAALCAPAHKWMDYHDKIYKNQPAEGAKGFSNEQLIGWARELGFATPPFERCVTGLQRQQQLNQVTDYALDVRKLSGTPTVFVNGKSLYKSEALFDPKKLQKVVLAGGQPG
jgi:protein-disulfide isomerase